MLFVSQDTCGYAMVDLSGERRGGDGGTKHICPVMRVVAECKAVGSCFQMDRDQRQRAVMVR